MKLSLKLKAFSMAVGAFTLCVTAGITVSFAISKIPVEALPWIALAALAGLAINLLYGNMLSNLEHKEALKRLNEKA